jgi:hypothetical protein
VEDLCLVFVFSYGPYIPEKILRFDIPFTSDALLQEAFHNKNSEMIDMLVSSGRVVNPIAVSFPFSKKTVIKEMLELFLKGLRTDNSRSLIWGDYVEV